MRVDEDASSSAFFLRKHPAAQTGVNLSGVILPEKKKKPFKIKKNKPHSLTNTKHKQYNQSEITKKTHRRTRRKKGGAALNSSRELAYLSTVSDVRELNCRVRNGSGWNLSAMAAESPKPSSRFERE